MEKITDVHRLVHKTVRTNLGAEEHLCFNYDHAQDVLHPKTTDLFKQDKDFYFVEVLIDSVQKAGPGVYTRNRVFGGIEITLYAKPWEPLSAMDRLEQVGRWFSQKTIEGVRFREFTPTGDGRDSGFNSYSATLAFEFETPAQGA